MRVSSIHRRFESSKSFLQTRLFRIATIATFAALPLLALQKPLYSAADAQPDAIFSTDVSAPSNDFGFRLLRNLADGRSPNVIVSPLSMSLALAMLNNGADGATKTAIAKTLGATSLTESAFNRNNSVLLKMIEQTDPLVRMEIANAVWVQSGLPINREFLELNREYYDAKVESLDFSNLENALHTINAWVNEKTHAKISKILDQLPPLTKLVLTDAVYYEGGWSLPFDPKKTEQRKFYLPSGTALKVPMMIQSDKYGYFENDAFQEIRLPYGRERFAMYVFLPRNRDGLRDFLSTLDESHWKEWTTALAERDGEIVLPKFESSYGTNLNTTLMQMGMSIAFSDRADFSRIAPEQLTIADVEHKTYVKVDEEGTVAAAVTGVSARLMVAYDHTPPFKMEVDHPFFCAIEEQQSGALLFAGLITNPRQR
jgi:serine protease inhibitor